MRGFVYMMVGFLCGGILALLLEERGWDELAID
jgi:hypothetical protein